MITTNFLFSTDKDKLFISHINITKVALQKIIQRTAVVASSGQSTGLVTHRSDPAQVTFGDRKSIAPVHLRRLLLAIAFLYSRDSTTNYIMAYRDAQMQSKPVSFYIINRTKHKFPTL